MMRSQLLRRAKTGIRAPCPGEPAPAAGGGPTGCLPPSAPTLAKSQWAAQQNVYSARTWSAQSINNLYVSCSQWNQENQHQTCTLSVATLTNEVCTKVWCAPITTSDRLHGKPTTAQRGSMHANQP
eukprot:362938-Chlamydomonas_euryale.AAC.8